MGYKVWLLSVLFSIFSFFIAPICTFCQKPDAPKDGFFTPDMDAYSMGDIITYSCFPDYDLLGSEKRTCQPSGKWTELTPFCDKPTVLNVPSWIPDRMIDGSLSTCHHIIHGMTFTMQIPGVVQAVHLHIPAQAQTKIAVLTIQDKTIQKCAEYLTNGGIGEWVLLKCETQGVADKIRILHLGDDENKIDICEVRAYTQNGEWCQYPPTVTVRAGFFIVSHYVAALRCSFDHSIRSDGKKFLTCKNNSWSELNFDCEKERRELTAPVPQQDSKEDLRNQDITNTNNHNTMNFLLSTVIILSFILVGFIMYTIWIRNDFGRKLFLKASWKKMTSDDCHL